MIKQKTILEVKKDEKIYELYMDPDARLGEIYDVLNIMRGFITDKIIEQDKAEKEGAKDGIKKAEKEIKE